MGWFEEQVKDRKKLDDKTFEDSFLSLAGIHVNGADGLDEKALKENFALTQILSFFRHQIGDIPRKITDFQEKANYVLRPYDILYHKVELNETLLAANSSPLLVFTKVNHTPVVLLPKGKHHYYINYKTGKKTKVNEETLENLEVEAYSFYRPLPSQRISVKEYAKYIQKSIRPLDIVLLILASAIVTGVGMVLPYLTKL